MKLATLLNAYLEPIQAGPGDSGVVPIEQLREQLESLRRENNSYFGLCVAMVLALFLAAVWLTLTYRSEMSVVGSTFAGLGISATGAVVLMTRLWREKVAIDFLLTFSTALTPDLMKTIIAVFARRLR